MAARGRRIGRCIPVTVTAALAICLAAALAHAADSENKQPLPRFASLRIQPVNLRAGPGERYPIEWVFVRKDVPIEIVAEFDNWRRIRDWQGAEGWVHERMVAPKRGVIVVGNTRALHRQPDPNAPLVARAEVGVIARLIECAGQWCRIEADDTTGWLQRNEVWGVFPDETVP